MMREDRDWLSADDAHILALESPTISGHTLKLIVLEPAAGPLDLDALRSEVGNRLHREPRATQRVDTSGPTPRWVEATGFDINDHVRRLAKPKCVSQADLWCVVGDLMSEHLDRSRPLWTFDVIGPLQDGREAIAARVHHAMADGISTLRLLDALLWDVHVDPVHPLGSTGPSLPSASVKRSHLAEVRRLPGAAYREFAHPGSTSPFDRRISGSRELAFAVVPLAEVKAIGASRPGRATVNDVLLAIVAGGLRRWLGGAEGRRLRAQVPVSIHHRDEEASDLGNCDSFINVDLPLGQTDPLERLDRINAETRERKTLGDAEELYDLFHALGRMKHIGSAARWLAGSAHEFSLSISNVPGPAAPVSVAGRCVQRLFSSSEPAAHHALRISAISCAGNLGIGLCTDPQALPDVACLAEDLEASYAELRRSAIG